MRPPPLPPRSRISTRTASAGICATIAASAWWAIPESLSGYVSRTALIPELKLGIVILTNQEVTAAHSAIANAVIDHYLGVPDADWVSAYASALEEAAGTRARKRSRRPPASATPTRSPRCRWPAMRAATATPGTATCASRSTPASSPSISPTLRTWRATWSTGSTTPSWPAGRIAPWMPTPT